MEGGEGMVAVVRGLRDSRLAVTLLDGNRQYTLMPNSADNMMQSSEKPYVRVMHDVASQQNYHFEAGEPMRSDSAAQATDGRYISVYKAAHCNLNPTSPPVELPEFPPQRAELCRGLGNFEVGGCGSGESHMLSRSSGSFRGRLSSPDKGSPRSSREPDAFADSLRKYPLLAAQRSAEMVERLINYTQAKNMSKLYQNRNLSPSRCGNERNSIQGVPERSTLRNNHRHLNCQKNYEYNTVSKEYNDIHNLNESPTRDDCARAEEHDQHMDNKRFGTKNNEVKNLKDVHRRIRDSNRVTTFYAMTSVDMEVQAAAEMVSKEVATIPRRQLEKRTVAVPLSSSTSSQDQNRKGEVSVQVMLHKTNLTFKSIQTAIPKEDFTVQAYSSTEMKTICNNFTKRKCKLKEIIATNKRLEAEILELFDNVVCASIDPTTENFRQRILKRMSAKLQKLIRNSMRVDDGQGAKDTMSKILKYVPVLTLFGNAQANREAISEEINDKMKCFQTIHSVCRAEVFPIQFSLQDELEHVIKKWIATLPIKISDSLGSTEKKEIVNVYTNHIQTLFLTKQDIDENTLRNELLSIVSKIPLNINDCHKKDYLNQVIESFMRKFKQITDQKPKTSDNSNSKFKIYVQPTEIELREVIKNNLNIFFDSHVTDRNIREYIELELIDILIESMQDLRLGKNNEIEEKFVILFQEVSDVKENEARSLANVLFSHLKKNVIDKCSSNSYCLLVIPIQNYVVFQSTTGDITQQNQYIQSKASFEGSIGRKTKQDTDANRDAYISLLTKQIEEWLQNTQMKIPDDHDDRFRQIVIRDLAEDIVDRHKYLEFNPSSRSTEDDELEHLKYQIFKWINKFAGEENMEPLQHAPELMRRIQSVPIPMNITPPLSETESFTQTKSNEKGIHECHNISSNAIALSSGLTNTKINNSLKQLNSKQQSLPPSCCSKAQANTSLPSIKQLNEDYDIFLKEWVKEIPIPSNRPEEITLADKARQGIYNGVWKVLTKLKFDPVVFHNRFYYEKALENEIDELLNYLPESPALNSKKHILKEKVIKETVRTNNLVLDLFAPASYKQQLIQNVSQNLPLHKMGCNSNETNNNKAFENLQIEKIVNDYILYMAQKGVKNGKSEIYRTKLLKKVQSVVENIEKTHGKELKYIDTDLYMNNILSALYKVPSPNDEVISKEAEDIQIAGEIQQWFTDLPILLEDDQGNQLKCNFVKRITDLRKSINYDCLGERTLKNEVMLFLSNISFGLRDNIDIEFMANELVNRIKNKTKDIQADENEKYKSVAFQDSVGYYEFSVQMPCCSSFIEAPDQPGLINQSSYMIRDGEKIQTSPNDFIKLGTSNLILPSNEYFTMVDSQAVNSKPKQTEISYHTIPFSQDMLERVPAKTLTNSNLLQQSPSCCPNEGQQSPHQDVPVPQDSSQAQMYKTPRGDRSFIPQPPPTKIDTSMQTSCGLRGEYNNEPSQSYSNILCDHVLPNRQNNEQFAPKPQEALDINLRRPVHTSNGSSQQCPQMTANPTQRTENITNVRNDSRELTYGQPQGFSTPQQITTNITERFPDRPDKKRNRRQPRIQNNFVKRRLDLDSDSDDDDDIDKPCMCMKRMLRHGRRYAYEDIDGREYYPYPYPCPYFY